MHSGYNILVGYFLFQFPNLLDIEHRFVEPVATNEDTDGDPDRFVIPNENYYFAIDHTKKARGGTT